jgi:primosomal protein N' (replication factor Y)
MIARVTLEIALRKEFDYFIPPALEGKVDVGSRVQVPFGSRKVFGCVTALAEESAHTSSADSQSHRGADSRDAEGAQALARWIADYYCCAPEIALKACSRKSCAARAGWRERLFVRALSVASDPKLPNASRMSGTLSRNGGGYRPTELLELAETTAPTVKRLEDRGLIEITTQISERDPYAREASCRASRSC